MSKPSQPITITLNRLPGPCLQRLPPIEADKSMLSGISGGFCIRMDSTEPSFIGETVRFVVSVQNHSTSPFKITSLEVFLISDKKKSTLEYVSTSDSSGPSNNAANSKETIQWDSIRNSIHPFTLDGLSTKSLHFSKLICYEGKQRVRANLSYSNTLTEFQASATIMFSSMKPFDLSFSRYHLSNEAYMVNSTVSNRLNVPILIHSVSSAFKSNCPYEVTYNSLSSPVYIQPHQKYSHILTLKGPIKEQDVVGSLGIYLSIPGHGQFGLSSSDLVVADVKKAAIYGYYEVPENMRNMEMSTITAVVQNLSNEVKTVHFDWSKMASEKIQVVGECLFTKFIPPNKTIRISLQVLPIDKGVLTINSPIVSGKDVLFSAISIVVL